MFLNIWFDVLPDDLFGLTKVGICLFIEQFFHICVRSCLMDY